MHTLIEDLLKRTEGRTLDFKQVEVKPQKALKTVCAFANTAGGYLVIGVDNNRTVRGVGDIEKLEEQYASLISDCISPYLSVDLQRINHEGEDILIIRVPRFPGAFRLSGTGGGVFVRQGSTNRAADAHRIEALEREATSLAWDERPCIAATMADIDLDHAKQLFKAVDKELSEPKLKTLRLLVNADGVYVPSNAAVILFGHQESRERLFPAARFRCARFAGTTKAEILDHLDIEDSVIDALGSTQKAEKLTYGPVRAFIRRNSRLSARIGKHRREDTPEYSDRILRELLPNAVAHADYSQKTMPLKVSIFRDRMEIENPGGWPLGFNIEDFKEGVSKIRNPVIANVLHQLKYMEGWGSGYERISSICEEFGYPEPEWIEQGSVLRVRLKPHPATKDQLIEFELHSKAGAAKTIANLDNKPIELNERQKWLLDQLEAGASVTAKEIAKHFSITPRTAERDIRQLRDAEIIVFVGAPKTGRYRRLKG